MPPTSKSLPRVLKSICDYDDSIKHDPELFIGFIKDLYCGGKNVSDDFIVVLQNLKSKIERNKLNVKDLSNFRSIGINDTRRCEVQAELFKSLYLNRGTFNVGILEKLITSAYEGIVDTQKNVYNKGNTSSILYFKSSSNEAIEYGKILTLSWKCNNPYRVSIYNGFEYMDVTGIESILFSAIFDKYYLLLYDSEGNVIDKKEVSIHFWTNSFCMNCGTPCIGDSDLFCINCGFKL